MSPTKVYKVTCWREGRGRRREANGGKWKEVEGGTHGDCVYFFICLFMVQSYIGGSKGLVRIMMFMGSYLWEAVWNCLYVPRFFYFIFFGGGSVLSWSLIVHFCSERP